MEKRGFVETRFVRLARGRRLYVAFLSLKDPIELVPLRLCDLDASWLIQYLNE